MVNRDLSAASAGTHQVVQVVAAIWTELLGRRPGQDDDFFALGGHSLLAARATARTRKALGVRLDMSLLFDHPVLASYAAEVEALRREESR